jgi:hypothetical protein
VRHTAATIPNIIAIDLDADRIAVVRGGLFGTEELGAEVTTLRVPTLEVSNGTQLS